MQRKIQKIIGIWLSLLSIFMVYKGATIYSITSGEVQGSEFGILITLANQFSLIMLWLATFALWTVAPSIISSSEKGRGEINQTPSLND